MQAAADRGSHGIIFGGVVSVRKIPDADRKKAVKNRRGVLMQKKCEMCARPFECKDGRRKYCDDCRKARKKMFDYNAVRKSRDAARQRRKDIEQNNADLIRENYELREKIQEIENRNRILCARLAVFIAVKRGNEK